MKSRDFVIVGAIVVVAGFATADAFRGGGDEAPATEARSATEAARTEIEVPTGFEPLPLAGSIVFTDADDCRVRRITMASGAEAPLPRLPAADCTLWAAPAGSAIAYGIGYDPPDVALFRLVDLRRPDRTLGGYGALFGFVTWSLDGRRVAWCGSSRAGFDLELGGSVRRLPECPSAYTPAGDVAFAGGSRLVADGRPVLEAEGGITYARWGADGSLAVVLDGRRVERRVNGRLAGELELPPWLEGRLPILSPDNCAAIFRRPTRLDLFSLGCFRGDAPRAFFDDDAAWSPDGDWIAVAEENAVAFHRLVGPRDVLRWPVRASRLAWQP